MDEMLFAGRRFGKQRREETEQKTGELKHPGPPAAIKNWRGV